MATAIAVLAAVLCVAVASATTDATVRLLLVVAATVVALAGGQVLVGAWVIRTVERGRRADAARTAALLEQERTAHADELRRLDWAWAQRWAGLGSRIGVVEETVAQRLHARAILAQVADNSDGRVVPLHPARGRRGDPARGHRGGG